MDYLITPDQTLAAARHAGLEPSALDFSGVALLTFSRAVVERLGELCRLEDAGWVPPKSHPYAGARVAKRGQFEGVEIGVIVPPMGASPLACLVEDLAACGVWGVFLVCAAWSLGPPVEFGDLIVPSFSLGAGGTSVHYGDAAGEVWAAPSVVSALVEACRSRGARFHVAGNGTCEALYRITPEMAERYRGRGCVCMDNGEASTLFAMGRSLGLVTGVVFQPYIDLRRGWDPSRLSDPAYQATCRLQAEVALEASVCLGRQRSPETEGRPSSARGARDAQPAAASPEGAPGRGATAVEDEAALDGPAGSGG